MEFNDSYGMRYAPEDDEQEENISDVVFCFDCGCSIREEEIIEGINGEMYCLECTRTYEEEQENEKDNY